MLLEASAEQRREDHTAIIVGAWHTAYLSRVEARHFPKLQELLPRVHTEVDERAVAVDEFRAYFGAHNAKVSDTAGSENV